MLKMDCDALPAVERLLLILLDGIQMLAQHPKTGAGGAIGNAGDVSDKTRGIANYFFMFISVLNMTFLNFGCHFKFVFLTFFRENLVVGFVYIFVVWNNLKKFNGNTFFILT